MNVKTDICTVNALLEQGHPRMVGQEDLRRVSSVASELANGSTILEMGPWLGFLSVELARHGDLHVVDNFVWTKDHARRVPGFIEIGDSFKPLFEDIMARTEGVPTVHESDFGDFEWDGPQIDLLVVDSPKNPKALFECLSSVIEALVPGARVLIKNGLNPKQHQMMGYIDRLIRLGLFDFDQDNDFQRCNIASLTVKAAPGARSGILSDALRSEPMSQESADSAPHFFAVVQMSQQVQTGQWSKAYETLEATAANPEMLRLWEELEVTLSSDVPPMELAIFSEIVKLHHDPSENLMSAEDDLRTPIGAARAFWINNAGQEWRARSIAPAVIAQASAFGYMDWPREIGNMVPGRDVLDVGCGSGLHGIGYLCLGANTFLGVDPSLRLDRDRVKNLAAKRREAFGWTPEQIAEQIEPWAVVPSILQDVENDRTFDLAVLNDCLSQSDDVDGLLAAVAKRLRAGGQIVLRHKNFYCWNGHRQAPKTIDAIDVNDPDQANLIDWKHLSWDAPEDHYTRRVLNRVRLDTLMQSVERYFDLDVLEEKPATAAIGHDRLTPEIMAQHPELSERDFLVQSLSCIATVK